MHKLTTPKLDWLTVSVPFKLSDRILLEGYSEYLNEELLTLFNTWQMLKHFEDESGHNENLWKHAPAVRPYPSSLRNDRYSVIVGYGGRHQNATIYLSATALDKLRHDNVLDEVIADLITRKVSVSRVDIAVDIINPATQPAELWKELTRTTDVKTRSWTDSESGTTLTIGSRKSSRYARVYRYANRLERPLTRLEIELKGTTALAALWKINNFSIEDVFWTSIKAMNLALTPDAIYTDLPKLEIERGTIPTTSSRAAWLKKQVIPAIKKMIEREEITLYQLVANITEIE